MAERITAKEGAMLYRRYGFVILVGLLFVLLVGPAVLALPRAQPPLTTSPSAPGTVPAPTIGPGLPDVAPLGMRGEPSIAFYNLLELWPLAFSLLLLISVLLMRWRHAHS